MRGTAVLTAWCDALPDRYMEFVESRCRANTVLATASELKVYFSAVTRSPLGVVPRDVLGFIAAQHKPRGDGRVVRLVDGGSGLLSRTI